MILNNKYKFLFSFIVLSFSLFSCDCLQIVRGKVLDEKTKQPIDSAYAFKVINGMDNSYTDKEGAFEIKSISGGLWGCPPMTVTITKKGYVSKTLTIEIGKETTIYLGRQ